MKNHDSIEDVMNDMQETAFINKSEIDKRCKEQEVDCDECEGCSKHNGQVINITVKPIIHTTTTSYVQETTKNPSLGEFGHLLTPIINLFNK